MFRILPKSVLLHINLNSESERRNARVCLEAADVDSRQVGYKEGNIFSWNLKTSTLQNQTLKPNQ